MAGQAASTDAQFNPYLSTTQQDLLLAALATNSNYNHTTNNTSSESSGLPNGNSIKRSDSDPSREKHFVPPSFVDGALFDTTQKPAQLPSDFGAYSFDDTSPFLEYLDGDTSLNFDSNDLGGEEMFGAEPGPRTESSDSSDKGERSDKRKNPDEADDEEEGDAKRREGEDKGAKKPGRKPLTSEPTTKRKAQNRAAQRAFRERKEKHLKDLETQVDSMTKASEADKHENGLLRAQVERLQSELREYKKRMSMNSTGISQSPPSISKLDSRSNSNSGSDFQFDFPRFGGLPGSQLFDNKPKRENISPGTRNDVTVARQNSLNKYPSSRSQPQSQHSSISQNPASTTNSRSASMNLGNKAPSIDGFNSTLPQMPATLFTASNLNGANNDYNFINNTAAPQQNTDAGGDSNSGISRAFRFNSRSASSNTASPSVSSLSQFNPNSSCGTSPESNHDSPPADVNKPKDNTNTYSFNSNPTNQSSFHNLGNGPTNNNVENNNFSFDWIASQNGGQFDPVLFGDYRDTQDAITGGDGDFNNGFFDDAFPYDFASPLNFNLNSPKQPQQTTPASRNLLAEVERAREGNDDDMLPPQTTAQQLALKDHIPLVQAEKMLNCNTIWSQLQTNPDFKDGRFDLDNLCAELRAKAKCSESGVTVPSEHVEAAFKKLSGREAKGPDERYTHVEGVDYLFQRESVDEALKRLGAGL